MILVIDESVACRWFVAEPGSDAAEALIVGGHVLNGPDLLDELVPSIGLSGRVLEIAKALAHPAYDCCYVALAEQRVLAC